MNLPKFQKQTMPSVGIEGVQHCNHETMAVPYIIISIVIVAIKSNRRQLTVEM